MNYKIAKCSEEYCQFRCCNFGGHIVTLPNENTNNIYTNHLNKFDGSNADLKVKCIACDKSNCDNGYKPYMCSVYPFWFNKEIMISDKCPMSKEEDINVLKEHFKNAFSLFIDNLEYDYYTKYAGVNRYSKFDIQERALGLYDLDQVCSIEMALLESDTFIRSTKFEIRESLVSGLSRAFFYKGKIVGYGLADKLGKNAIQLEKYYVVPEFRGWGFQYLGRKMLFAKLKNRQFELAKVYVSSRNIPSIKNLKKLGFAKVGYGMVNGLERNIMTCEL